MLPFPRPLVYGNTIIYENWWDTSDVIMAFDSKNFVKSTDWRGTGFTDYKSKHIVADSQSTESPFPDIVQTGVNNNFGSPGICLYGAGLVVNNSQIPSTLTNSSFTVDFWYRQTTTTLPEFIPFMIYRNMASNDNKYTLWYYLVDGQGARYQNNGTNTVRMGTAYGQLASTSWLHYAYVYDYTTKAHYVYINGTMIDTFTLSISQPTSATFVGGVGGHVNSPSGTNNSFIDRFRLRTSAVWTSNFNTSTIYNGN